MPIIYGMIGFAPNAEAFFFYLFMFTATISFYTIFGQFMVYVTPSQQIAQVGAAARGVANAACCIANRMRAAPACMQPLLMWLRQTHARRAGGGLGAQFRVQHLQWLCHCLPGDAVILALAQPAGANHLGACARLLCACALAGRVHRRRRQPQLPAASRHTPLPPLQVLYGLGASQLGDVSGKLVQFAGRRMPVSAFTHALFGYEYGMRWWCLAIVLGYVVFFRVTSILALKYVNFLRR